MSTFEVKDAFRITGRGIVVTGTCLSGEINLGDILHTDDEEELQVTITGIERFVREIGKPVKPGDSAGLLLREVKTIDEIPPGTILKSYDYVL